ncbi:MAG: HTTM domain-containing protein [Planctomycetota bacterium]|nr:HTTM domain-containing protein [Planctomycetota bacterium]
MIERVRIIFGCDLRSLAIFRIALALAVFYDVIDRFSYAELFYSDQGFFDTEFSKAESPCSFSVNQISGAILFQQGIFFLLATSAVCLAIGFYTKIATWVCWLLVVSIHVRNPFVLIGGDTLIRLMLFWSLFIPLGKIWSIDDWWKQRSGAERVRGMDSKTLSTAATACLIFQVCLVYWCAGASKLTETWLDGTAMEYVLRLEIYVRPFGEWILNFPWLLKAMAYGTLGVELLVPFLLFLPVWTDRFRILVILIFWGLHVGIELALDVGNFGVVSMIIWLPLVPGICWTAFSKKPDPDPRQGPESNQPETGSYPEQPVWWRGVISVFVPVFFLIYIVIWNYYGMYILRESKWRPNLPESFFQLGQVTMVAQNFQMFGDPPRNNPWFVFNGMLKDGTEIDLLRDQPARLSRPDKLSKSDVSPQWKKIHRFLLRHDGHHKFHQALLVYYSQKWNKDHSPDQWVMQSHLECYYEPIGPLYRRGDYVRRPDLASWKAPQPKEKTEIDLIDDVDSFFNGLNRDTVIPLND